MDINKLEKIAGLNKKQEFIVKLDDSKILDKLDEVKNSFPNKNEFDDSNIILLLSEIKNIFLSESNNKLSNKEEIKEIVSKINILEKSVIDTKSKIIPVNIDLDETNKSLEKVSRNILKLETPFVWIKDYFIQIANYLKEILFFFEKPKETILIKKDGKIVEITYKYKNREVTEKITRNIGETRFTRNE